MRIWNAKPRRGAAAIAMVILLLLMNLIIIGMVLGGARDHDLTVRRVETVQAFYAAEAGINMAVRELIEDADEDGDGTIGSISDDGNDANNPTFGMATVLVTKTVAGTSSIIDGIGSAGASTRSIETLVDGGPSGSTPGVAAAYYALSSSPSVLADIDFTVAPHLVEPVANINIASHSGSFWTDGPTNSFAVKYTGNVTVPSGGDWTFYTRSDDGSKLWIDGTEVVDNDGVHGMATASGMITLSSGVHAFETQFFDGTGSAGIIVYWSGPGVPGQTVIPSSAFTH